MEPARIEAIYEELGKYSVDLSADAWSLGPRHIHELISRTRGFINSVTFILQEILQERQRLDREKHAAESVFSLESDRLLAENDHVRRMPAIDDRKSTINVLLRDHVRRIQELTSQLLDLSYVEKVVKTRYSELKATMSDIKAQRALIRDAIDSGSYYGDETETSRGTSMPSAASDSSSVPGFSEDEFDQEMSALNDMMLGKTPASPEPEPEPEVILSERELAVEDHESTVALPEAPKEAKPKKPKTKPVPEPKEAAPTTAEDDFSDLIEGLEESPPPPAVATPVDPAEDPDLASFLNDDDFSLGDSESV